MLGMDGTSGIDENRHHRRRATAARADASRAEQLPSRQLPGAVAEWLRSGLPSRVHRFDSGRRLSVRAVDAPARRWVAPRAAVAALHPPREREVGGERRADGGWR